jgi:hypothetical protein
VRSGKRTLRFPLQNSSAPPAPGPAREAGGGTEAGKGRARPRVPGATVSGPKCPRRLQAAAPRAGAGAGAGAGAARGPAALRALRAASRAGAAALQSPGPAGPAALPPPAAPTSPDGGRADAASHIGRGRAAAQAAAGPATLLPPQPRRSPLFAGLAATKWR